MAEILKEKPLPYGRDADNFGYVYFVDEACKLIVGFETGSKFSYFKADKGFGNTGMCIYIYIYMSVIYRRRSLTKTFLLNFLKIFTSEVLYPCIYLTFYIRVCCEVWTVNLY